MLDFTSALYLGMRHAHHSLRPWLELTTGRPAALDTPREAERVAHHAARLSGCEQGTLGTSTLHLFWDLFDILARDGIAIYTDAGAYPIARWGIERVIARGVPAADFQSHDARELEDVLNRHRGLGLRPVVVTDGICPLTGEAAPLPEYLRMVRTQCGYLVIDDTQALGVLGHNPTVQAPYGFGGAGTPAWYGINGPELIVVSSFAKAFGAPLAVIAGSTLSIAEFEHSSATRVHCSPPSLAAIAAAERALLINATQGNQIRGYLLSLVQSFRGQLKHLGLAASGGVFPVQTLKPIRDIEMDKLHHCLLQQGVKTVLHRVRDARDASLSFLITSQHTPTDIDAGISALQQARAVARRQSRSRRRSLAHYCGNDTVQCDRKPCNSVYITEASGEQTPKF
jgi:8-amino-7-oxononanoate synthase